MILRIEEIKNMYQTFEDKIRAFRNWLIRFIFSM